ncbi:hypothetical protein B7R54_17770 [Subtercola boreus]|uniref:HTH marR-type domain-containing protein n=1 Tax=Subtercola boreus TaxID=120213 RepID=A0A3E0VPR5_9MICO|nr:MarR family transcriptional regulator [Subtercola boreus]RFA10847.1 hypothetical protein B7R54_17770 [Subtercola boreus]TQL55570.1 DNA-binding MarR family transcriptional regulator [Subtercola boreus]
MTSYSDFFSELVRLEITVWDRLDDAQKAATGTTVAQLQALRAISGHGGTARVQDVSDALQITVGAASKLIDRLERDGLAERSAHPVDRRSMVIALTASGTETFERASAAADRNLEDLLGDGLTPERATELAAVLAELHATLRDRKEGSS